MNDTVDMILKFCNSSLSPADNVALSSVLQPSANDAELSTQTALQALSFLRDKLPMSDMTKLIGLLGESVDYNPARDDNDIENMPPPPAALTGGIPLSERKAMATGQDDPPPFPGRPTVGGKPQGQDRRHRRHRSFTQLAFDTVLKRGGNKAALAAEAAADYAKRWPEIARVGGLPTYGAKPQAARKPLPTQAQEKSYAESFPDTTLIQH